MICLNRVIPFELQDLVSCILFFQYDSPNEEKFMYLHPPTPETGFCFHLKEQISVLKTGSSFFEVQPKTVLVGLQLTPVIIQSESRYCAVRVGLLPGALYRFTGITQTAMVDQSFDAELIFGSSITQLNRALTLTENPRHSMDLIVEFLISLLPTCLNPHPIDQQLYGLWSSPDPKRIEKLAASCGCSLRQFERLSLRRIGVRAKLYDKIIRFAKAYRMVERKEFQSWTDLAYMNNYYDSKHLKKDFRNFTGRNLKRLEQEVSQSPFYIQSQLVYEPK